MCYPPDLDLKTYELTLRARRGAGRRENRLRTLVRGFGQGQEKEKVLFWCCKVTFEFIKLQNSPFLTIPCSTSRPVLARGGTGRWPQPGPNEWSGFPRGIEDPSARSSYHHSRRTVGLLLHYEIMIDLIGQQCRHLGVSLRLFCPRVVKIERSNSNNASNSNASDLLAVPPCGSYT